MREKTPIPIVAAITAIGTFRCGFCTLSILEQAVSNPKNAHKVKELEALIACNVE